MRSVPLLLLFGGTASFRTRCWCAAEVLTGIETDQEVGEDTGDIEGDEGENGVVTSAGSEKGVRVQAGMSESGA